MNEPFKKIVFFCCLALYTVHGIDFQEVPQLWQGSRDGCHLITPLLHKVNWRKKNVLVMVVFVYDVILD